jgi:hypothetical protein
MCYCSTDFDHDNLDSFIAADACQMVASLLQPNSMKFGGTLIFTAERTCGHTAPLQAPRKSPGGFAVIASYGLDVEVLLAIDQSVEEG